MGELLTVFPSAHSLFLLFEWTLFLLLDFRSEKVDLQRKNDNKFTIKSV